MDALKENEAYILLESLISLVILIILVTSYVGVTAELRQESQERLASLANYRDLYNETRRCRLHSVKSSKDQIEISFEKGRAYNHQGGIRIVKK
ncbi:competence type IV pilus minor pilin ComGE [Enterococcus devriesei]|uniref:competence type IV pilus minor pilin ComGE n=1 Tax=Enterococcus TaxID=1350 RepID=UPI0028919769|nr:competence type IV pilus minor pilin ComGE [Enterococcus devriesei]MDT2821508.1 competence type IV pilus minor pilin ComGE [Enterococcus devriesei]